MICRNIGRSLTNCDKARAAPARQRGLFSLNGVELDFKDEGRVGANVCARTVGAVSKIGRNEKLPLGADGHELESFGPSFDHAIDRKGGGLAALVGAVKFLAVD